MNVVIIGSTRQLRHDLMRVFNGNAIGLNHQDFDVAGAERDLSDEFTPAGVGD